MEIKTLPFTITRTDSIIGDEVIATTERVHGLLRLEGDRLVIQWRTSTSSQLVGSEIRTDRTVGEVREATVPLSALSAATVRRTWWRWPPGSDLVLTGSDLRSFEAIAGEGSLAMEHPAELRLRLGRAEFRAGLEFAADLGLAIAEGALHAPVRPESLPRSDATGGEDARRAAGTRPD